VYASNYRLHVLLAASPTVKRKRLMESSCCLYIPFVSLSVGRSVRKVFCGKTAKWIRIAFEMESGVG